MNVPPNIPSAAGSQITTGLQNTSGQQIMAGAQYNTATNTPLPSPPGSELPLQSSTLQQVQGHSLSVPQSTPAPSGFSVIESEIFIPDDEEPNDNRNSNVYDASHLRGPPIILNEDTNNLSDRHKVRSFQGDTYFIAGQQNETKPPLYSQQINRDRTFDELQYVIPPPQKQGPIGLQYVIPEPTTELEKKVPLEQLSNFGAPASTIVLYESGPSSKPLPPKVDQTAQKPARSFRDRRGLCCFVTVLVAVLILIVVTLAVVIPILRLHEWYDIQI